tara:strand:+ start:2627 stop:3577 length:951 start_codon:yes stop_codon:yes gene_type:complete
MFNCFQVNASEVCNQSNKDLSKANNKKIKNNTNMNEMIEAFFRNLSVSSKRNCRLRFLLLLRDEDYKKCFWSRKDMICYRKSQFPGQLIIERFSEVDTLPYNIEGPTLPRTLYIMLPKEKLFIPSDNFTIRYIDSKLQELKNIFVTLQAKSIKVRKVYSTEDSKRIGAEGGTSFSDGIHSVFEVDDLQLSRTSIINEMTFGEPLHNISLEYVSNNSNSGYTYYYLGKEFEWQNIIQRRLKDNMLSDKYTYRNTEQKLFTSKLINTLKLLDLNIEYDWKKLMNLEIHYEIEYYPFRPLKKLDLDVDDIFLQYKTDNE